ncbi:hypothetical protein KKA24_01685 [Patescibacteria group bacterium]|nr:hypothetical protein [Patescibacteria group bacterium]
MTNLSAKDIKNLGASEGEINQYKKEGLLDLALIVVNSRGFLIEKTEFIKKNEKDKKLYHPNIHKAIKLLRQLKEEKSFNVNETKKELERKIKEKEKKRPKFKNH